MSNALTTLLESETVAGIADEVWSALVGAEEILVPLAGELPASPLAGWVSINGPWTGFVVLTCGREAAEDLSREVLGLCSDEDPADEDVEDVLGELANVLGGNVKSLLPGPSSLGLPTVGTPPRPGRSDDTCRVDVLWRGHPLTITVQGPPGNPLHAELTEVTP